MSKSIENLIQVEIASSRESMIFQLLGKFGDRIPKDVQAEMREEAELENRVQKKLKKRVANALE